VARSLPFLVRGCPDYWRLKCDGKLTAPVAKLLPPRIAQPTSTNAVALAGGGESGGGSGNGSASGGGGGGLRNRMRRLRALGGRVGSPAVAAEPNPASDTAVATPADTVGEMVAEARRRLHASKLTVRGKATLAADSLPPYETEALGGDGAIVRGYEVDELGRTHSSLGGTLELMVPLSEEGGQPIGLALFTDAGGGTVQLAGKDEMALRGGVAAGFGIRYGPFRVDYAFNHEGRKKVHVGLAQD
jgi:hypothetical protein